MKSKLSYNSEEQAPLKSSLKRSGKKKECSTYSFIFMNDPGLENLSIERYNVE